LGEDDAKRRGEYEDRKDQRDQEAMTGRWWNGLHSTRRIAPVTTATPATAGRGAPRGRADRGRGPA